MTETDPKPIGLDAIALRVRKLSPLRADEEKVLRLILGARCRTARELLGLSQRALAKTMGRSPSWVREVETGAQYAPPYLVRALATAIGISAGWFYGEAHELERP